jgi:hypothetical protein
MRSAIRRSAPCHHKLSGGLLADSYGRYHATPAAAVRDEGFERSGGKYAHVDMFEYLTGWAPL